MNEDIFQIIKDYVKLIGLDKKNIVTFTIDDNNTKQIEDITIIDTMKNINHVLLIESLYNLSLNNIGKSIIILRKVDFSMENINTISNGLDLLYKVQNENYDFQVIDYLLSDGLFYFSLVSNDLI
ncbi:hypothetical protein BW727_101361 [Jeotgalibaca dankookensis]|uniref:Uncharacterized protein n=1 Tax=Jeotgalibaca dankookensis TaxID=708126 RepID=A0A1S6IQA7_9LACT|nr:hypothetical protein [Jeotgalibaca dankookensis]AQS53728.1 hypothetical protein BW727_101361 [Jeotgalibaca dankookensis]